MNDDFEKLLENIILAEKSPNRYELTEGAHAIIDRIKGRKAQAPGWVDGLPVDHLRPFCREDRSRKSFERAAESSMKRILSR